MSGRGTWRLATVIMVLALAVVFTLDLDLPEWASGLLFWRAEGQREIELSYGPWFQEGLQVKLLPSFGYLPDADALESSRRILQDRLGSLEPTSTVIEVLGDGSLLVEISGVRERTWLTHTLQSVGLIEFIDASFRYAEPGTVIETNLGQTGAPKPEDTISTGMLVTPTAAPEETGPVYDTVLSSEDLGSVHLEKADQFFYLIRPSTPTAQEGFADFTRMQSGRTLCAAIDKLVLYCYSPEGPMSGWPLQLSEEQAAVYRALLSPGPLPLPLQIWETAVLGPTLGENTVRLVAIGAGIGLAAVAVFLVAHYRLAGLVASLVVVAFGLTAIALCKLIPVSLTLPALAGLVIAGVVALGSVIAAFERLREEKRARGLISLRSIGGGFSAVRSTVRSVHLCLLALAAVLWYVGVTAESPSSSDLGRALLFGALAGLFAARLVAIEFARLALGSAREPLNRSVWLVGV